jgi:hypothetical protein
MLRYSQVGSRAVVDAEGKTGIRSGMAEVAVLLTKQSIVDG